MKSETDFTSNNVNPKFSTGSSTPVTTPASTWQPLYLHLKPIQKMFVLVSMLFSLQMQTWKLIPNFVLQTSNTPQNDQEESFYWFLTESHADIVLKTPQNGHWTVLLIALALWYLLIWCFLTNRHFSLHLGYIIHQFYFFSKSKYVYSNRKNH